MTKRNFALLLLLPVMCGCAAVSEQEIGDREAARWMGYAAEEGNAYAMFNYGQCCLFGDGVAQDRVLGEKYLRLAAANGYPEALEILKEAKIQAPAPVK